MHLRQRFYYFAVVMKSGLYISLLLYCMLGLTACTGPIILDEEEKTESNSEQDNKTNTRDSVAIIHDGSYASPYSIAEAQILGRGKSVWVEGYIVGSVSNNSLKNGCNFTENATTASNILLADTFPTGRESDYLYCLPVQLLNGSIERDDLNLYDNPENYHRRLRVKGDITLYINQKTGIKEITDYIFCDEIIDEEQEEDTDNSSDSEDNEEEKDESEEPEIPDTPDDPDKTNTDTLSIAEGIKLQNRGEQAYIKGYIVGYYNGSTHCFNPTEEQISTRARNNVVLADSVGETDANRVIIVELPTQTSLRSKVNLKDNPHNLHRTLTVKGMMMDYKDTFYYGCMGTLSNLGNDEDYYFLIE